MFVNVSRLLVMISKSFNKLVFIDDLSVWYLRRSRERLKGENEADKKLTLSTLRYVLKTLAQVMAPAMPFYADYLWQKVRAEDEVISVHLSKWPIIKSEVDLELLSEMQTVRSLVTFGLEARTRVNIKVRQPLQRLSLKSEVQKEVSQFLSIISDEINVKEIVFSSEQTEMVILDTNITPELKMEGEARDLIRSIQDMRKEIGLVPQDSIGLEIKTEKAGEDLLNNLTISNMIKKTVGANEIIFTENLGKEIKAGENSYIVSIIKM